MSGMWLGSIISVDCGDVLGVFEGEISNVDGIHQTISLINVSRNSVKCQVPEVTLSTHDIKKLQLLESTVNKVEKNFVNGEDDNTLTQTSSSRSELHGSPVTEDNQRKKCDRNKRPARRSNSKKRLMKDRDEECFNAPVDFDVLDKDFDFEKNLALFDKRAIFEEINALSKGDHVKLVDCNKKGQTKYRHDENVLANDIPILKQISVPCKFSKEYVTDTGLIIPSVSVDFKKRLYAKGEEFGLMPNVRMEMIGRAACDMVMHLVGGSHRLNPQNNHQRPLVVILCGSHVQGAQAVNCGRHLANHCINVTILSPMKAKETNSVVSSEMRLFNLSSGKTVNSISGLPSFVDLIVDALESHESTNPDVMSWLSTARHWAQQSKAPVLGLDPPPNCSSIDHNFILSPALPLAFKHDKCSIHICDIGFPDGVFRSVGCLYSSPFGSKFVIPLYNRHETEK